MQAKVLFNCDAWKSHTSMRVIGVFTNHKSLFYAIKNLLQNKIIESNNCSKIKFQEFKTMTDSDINVNFDYLYIQTYEINHVESEFRREVK